MGRGIATIAAMLALAGCGTLEVREVGSFHIGGRTETLSGLPPRDIVLTPGAAPLRLDPNGAFEVEQMYVQFVKLAQPKARYPLLMWHGGGMTGATWETKPDGRPGWQMYFLKAGHDVYVSDAVERGRASWARYPEIFAAEPLFRSKREAWELFRIGPPGSYRSDPVRRVTFVGQRFPTEAFDQFMKQGVPHWSTNDAATQLAYDRLVQKVCPCVLLVHGQGGRFGLDAARRAPDRIRAVIAIEPNGAPDPAAADAAAVKDIPHLFVWGDNLDKHDRWVQVTPAIRRWHDALRAAGGSSDWGELPALGVPGNTHMLMMDTNSDQIAGMIQSWMSRRGLMR